MTNYYDSELGRVLPRVDDEYGVSIKVNGAGESTKWMRLNLESIEILKDFLDIIKEDLEKKRDEKSKIDINPDIVWTSKLIKRLQKIKKDIRSYGKSKDCPLWEDNSEKVYKAGKNKNCTICISMFQKIANNTQCPCYVYDVDYLETRLKQLISYGKKQLKLNVNERNIFTIFHDIKGLWGELVTEEYHLVTNKSLEEVKANLKQIAEDVGITVEDEDEDDIIVESDIWVENLAYFDLEVIRKRKEKQNEN